MKFTTLQIIQLWNALDDLMIINDRVDPEFSTWKKRFQIFARPETELWNQCSISERKLISDEIIELPVEKISAKHCPERITSDIADVVSVIFSGEITKPESKLLQLLQTKKEEEKQS